MPREIELPSREEMQSLTSTILDQVNQWNATFPDPDQEVPHGEPFTMNLTAIQIYNLGRALRVLAIVAYGGK